MRMPRQSLPRKGCALPKPGCFALFDWAGTRAVKPPAQVVFRCPFFCTSAFFEKARQEVCRVERFRSGAALALRMREDAVRSFARKNDSARGHNQRGGGMNARAENESGGRSFASKTLCPGENVGALP